MPVNSAYQLKPEPKHRAKKTRNAGKSPTSARSGSKPATALTAKLKGSNNPKKVRLAPEERKARAAEKRQELKALGLCKNCRQRAIPGQTRCIDCAETTPAIAAASTPSTARLKW